MSLGNCKGVDWRAELLQHGATDCFAGTLYEKEAFGFAKPPGSKAKVKSLQLCVSMLVPLASCLAHRQDQFRASKVLAAEGRWHLPCRSTGSA